MILKRIKILNCIFLSVGLIFMPIKVEAHEETTQRSFILDVDMNTDTDDLWAIRAAGNLNSSGENKLLAIMMSVSGGEEALSSFLTYEGMAEIPIGRCSIDLSDSSPYWEYLQTLGIGVNEKYDAVKLYRKILSESDSRISIVTTGYLTNIKALLESPPDEFSELDGYELVKKKVRAIHITGGNVVNHWDNNFGFCQEAKEASIYVFNNWPYEIPVVIYTNDLGASIKIGADVTEADPIGMCQKLSGRDGSISWDIFNIWAFNCMDHNKLRSNHLSLSHCDISISPEGHDNIVDNESSNWWRITKTVQTNEWYKQQLVNLLTSEEAL